jgi:hypothetical protein
MTQYLDQVTQLSDEFSSLVAEALGLPPDALARFYDKPEYMQHRLKVIKYPATEGYNQGVGPHYDPAFLTLVSNIFLAFLTPPSSSLPTFSPNDSLLFFFHKLPVSYLSFSFFLFF